MSNRFIEAAIERIRNSEYKDESIRMGGTYDETIGEWTKNPRTEEYMEMIKQRHPDWKLELKRVGPRQAWYLFITKP